MFLTLPMPEICDQDSERRQDVAETERTHDATVATFIELRFGVSIRVRAEVAIRIACVIDRIASCHDTAASSSVR